MNTLIISLRNNQHINKPRVTLAVSANIIIYNQIKQFVNQNKYFCLLVKILFINFISSIKYVLKQSSYFLTSWLSKKISINFNNIVNK